MNFKQEMLYFGKKMVQEKLVASTWGNISCLVEPGKILITPSGMEYDFLEEDDLVLVDFSGRVLEGRRKPSSELLMHIEIYKNRKDVTAIVHTHSLYASAYAASRQPVPPLIEDMAMVVGGWAEVSEYALPGSQELARNVVKALGLKGAALIANHGVVGVGGDLSEAYKACLLVEKTAHIGLATKILGTTYILSDQEVELMRKTYLTAYGQKKGRG
ncbi:MAG: class II aldolase/adducin family protein [Clostridia bacterium]|nr:class II aldolase/adducin family protein [Clostridia bacterium]